MKVFVLSQEGEPLMPTTPRRARLWLKEKLARVARQEPFTIQLRFETTTYTQSVTVGVDTGSKVVGKAAWLPPSLRSKADATVKTVRFVASWLPVSQVIVEVGSFDTQKMQHPEISGVSYQQGELQGYLVREYVLAKWKRQCSYCRAAGIPLQLEHIIPKARGGSDRVSNLALACEPCNQKKGTQTASEFGYPKIQVQARVPLKDAAHVSSIKTSVVQELRGIFGTA